MSIENDSPQQAEHHALAFSFGGNAREYFGIWIVNLLLSIVTIGIYTAWAKVRRLRYFYGNTFLDGHNFEYHAQPKQILIGRIIVLAVILLFNLIANFLPLLALVLFVPYLIAIPWVINTAIRFNARMTSYRNVRFGFKGNYWKAMGVFVAMPLAVLASAGLLAPVGSRLVSNYIGNGLSYGTAKFATDAPIGKLYKNFGVTLLFVISGMILLAVIMAVIAFVVSITEIPGGPGGMIPSDLEDPFAFTVIAAGVFAFYAVTLFSYIFYRAGVRNIAYNATSLDQKHRLDSSLSRVRYFWIIVSNFVVVIATLGLMRPWAAIRTWRYTADKTRLLADGSLDEFVSRSQMEGNVAAAEFLDIEGIDFGL